MIDNVFYFCCECEIESIYMNICLLDDCEKEVYIFIFIDVNAQKYTCAHYGDVTFICIFAPSMQYEFRWTSLCV